MTLGCGNLPRGHSKGEVFSQLWSGDHRLSPAFMEYMDEDNPVTPEGAEPIEETVERVSSFLADLERTPGRYVASPRRPASDHGQHVRGREPQTLPPPQVGQLPRDRPEVVSESATPGSRHQSPPEPVPRALSGRNRSGPVCRGDRARAERRSGIRSASAYERDAGSWAVAVATAPRTSRAASDTSARGSRRASRSSW